MAQNGCSYDEAFRILAKASSHRNIKVRVIAETILESVPDGHFDPEAPPTPAVKNNGFTLPPMNEQRWI